MYLVAVAGWTRKKTFLLICVGVLFLGQKIDILTKAAS